MFSSMIIRKTENVNGQALHFRWGFATLLRKGETGGKSEKRKAGGNENEAGFGISCRWI